MLQKLWYDRPVRTQLLVAVALINLLAGVAAAAVSILNTRTATRVEIEASLEVAQRFVNAAIKDLSSQGKLDQLPQYLPLQLKHLRHVRIYYMDVMGQLSVASPPGSEVGEVQPPQWFVLVNGETHSLPQRRGASAVQPLEHWNPVPKGTQIGVAGGQMALQVPQLVAFERSVSQPSDGLPLQSA